MSNHHAGLSTADATRSADTGAAILHYIHDPLCGWCYGAAPLVKAAREVLPVQAHGGGLKTGSRRRRVTPQLRDYVMPHDRRIAELTGQPFGDAYFNGLLCDPETLFDRSHPLPPSSPPTGSQDADWTCCRACKRRITSKADASPSAVCWSSWQPTSASMQALSSEP